MNTPVLTPPLAHWLAGARQTAQQATSQAAQRRAAERPAADPLDLPSALWSPQWAVQRLDRERCVGVASAERATIVRLGEAVSEWVRHQSTPAFAASMLGL